MMLPNNIVRNIRYGLATNSSSSHSIIHHPYENIQDEDISDFGWSFFTLASKEAKKEYMIAQLLGNFAYTYKEIFKYILGQMGHDDIRSDISEMYVDHQSQMDLPNRCVGSDQTSDINLEFFDEYMEYIVEGSFVILGGNDNDTDGHRLENLGDDKPHYYQKFRAGDTVYKNGNYWVVNNEGRKLRIQFQGDEPKAEFPELIDLKITDYCNLGCDFCYMDSTTNGQHSSLEHIKKIVLTMSPNDAGIEFAIGGGEPTTHPEFIDIISFINNRGDIANFTTRSKSWFKNPDIVNAVHQNVKGIAYSVETVEEAEAFIALHRKHLIDGRDPSGHEKHPEIYLHLIPEVLGHEKFRELVAWVDTFNKTYTFQKPIITLTILGFKEIGRAQPSQRQIVPEILEIILFTGSTPIGVDTKFANDYRELLDKAKVHRKLYTLEEGQYSMYIDAVKGLGYKSSYDLDQNIMVIDPKAPTYRREDRKEIFEKIKTF